MSRALICHSAGPGVSVQDMGRSGTLAFGLSRGGAADRLALYEGAALLGQAPGLAAIEMNGTGGCFEATAEMRIALTGAPMKADIDGKPIVWNAAHLLDPGARLTLGAVTSGSYGYLHLGGGVDMPVVLGARSAHLTAGLGAALAAGDRIPVGPDTAEGVNRTLDAAPRFSGGEVRVVSSLQTGYFPKDTLDRFEKTEFSRDPRANRQGVKMAADGAGFHVPGGLQVVSEVIVPGDIQVTGDGTPFVLIAESQTTGGYPRIATVIPPDLPRVAQAGAGTKIRFRFIMLEDAVEALRRDRAAKRALPGHVRPLVRDPADLPNLREFQLISGAIADVDVEES